MEINLYTFGNSYDINTWSNVPYFWGFSLEKADVKVNRIDISVKGRIITALAKMYKFLQSRAMRKSGYNFYRSVFYRSLVYMRIKRLSAKFPNADFHLFLTASYNNPYTDRPNIHFFDWTYSMTKKRYGIPPLPKEQRYIEYEYELLRKAQFVFPMFPLSYRLLKEEGLGKNMYYLNRNVVNDAGNSQMMDRQNLVAARKGKSRILFIGRKQYIDGAKLLMEACRLLKEKMNDLELHIIGLNKCDFDLPLPEFINCYGFLHKDDNGERIQYYKLLKNCTIYCNPTSYWGGVQQYDRGYVLCPPHYNYSL